jgi:hypothetical protein
MEIFKTVTVFEMSSGDVYAKMCESASYIQAIYCFPSPSEYFATIEQKINDERSYFEQHIYFHDEEKYKEWYAVFGEILEELVEEIAEDFAKNNISYRRFFDNVEISGAARAEPMSDFQTKFDENNKSLDLQ